MEMFMMGVVLARMTVTRHLSQTVLSYSCECVNAVQSF